MLRGTPGAWDEEDEWYSDHFEGARHVRPRRPSRPQYLAPETHTVHLHRTRSQGHSPTPHISIYNTVDDHQRVSQAAPSPRGSPRGRPTRLADELDDLETLEELRRARSRSRGPLFRENDTTYERMQLELAQERLRDKERERREEDMKESIRREYEYKKEKERRKREERERDELEERKRILTSEQLKQQLAKQEAEDERKRIITAEQLKQQLAKKEAEDERKRIIAEENERLTKAKLEAEEMKARARAQWDKEEKEAKEKRQRAIDEWELKRRREEAEEEEAHKKVIAEYEAKKLADSKKAKDEEERWRIKIQMEDAAKKEKEKKEYEEFLRKQKEKEEEEKRKKQAEEDALADAMTKRLMIAGFQNNQIQAIIKPDAQHPAAPGATPARPIAWQQPTYIKVHRDHLSVDTLTYFDIPWEYDRADAEYIIILREMDTRETDMLFEHTRSLRSRGTTRLLIEERRDRGKPEYAWVRHRSKSRSPARRRSSPKRNVGIKEMFF